MKPLYIILAFVGITVWWFSRGKLGVTTYDTADLLLFFVSGSFILKNMLFTKFKYMNSKFIADNLSFASHYTPVFIKGWAIFSIGDIKIVDMKGRDGTCIVRRTTLHKYGDQWSSEARCFKVDKNWLPESVRDFLSRHTFNMDNVWVGFTTAEFESVNPETIDYQNELFDANTRINELSSFLRDKFADRDEFFEHYNMVFDQMTKRHRFSRWIKKLSGNKEEDDVE